MWDLERPENVTHGRSGASAAMESHGLAFSLKSGYEPCRFSLPDGYAAAQRLLNAAGAGDRLLWRGGYEGAERRRALFLPDWADEEAENGAIVCLRARFRGMPLPAHRDILGSLMGLGITREKLGDILVDE